MQPNLFGNAVAAPGSAVAAPGNAVAAPGNAVAAPGNAVAAPGNAVAVPRNAVAAQGTSASPCTQTDLARNTCPAQRDATGRTLNDSHQAQQERTDVGAVGEPQASISGNARSRYMQGIQEALRRYARVTVSGMCLLRLV